MAGGPDVPAAEEPQPPDEQPAGTNDATPSGGALAEVGPPPDGASDEELVEHAERYAAAKRARRWG